MLCTAVIKFNWNFFCPNCITFIFSCLCYAHSNGSTKTSISAALLQFLTSLFKFPLAACFFDFANFFCRNLSHYVDIFQPQNILLTDSLPNGDIKLCDFGLARPFNSGDDVVELVGTLDYVGK